MAVAAVAELVRDDGQHLGRRRGLDERVVEHDAPRRSEPRDVRVQLRRALARVGDEHLAHRHAGVGGELDHRGPELRVLERAELVEDRLEHDRRDEAEQQHEQCGSDRRDHRPGRREDHRGADEPGHAQPGQHRADPDPLDAVERILPARLAREAERALVREPEPDRERQPDERREDDEERTEGERAERFGQRVDDPGERMSRRRERDEREECEPDREVGEDRAVARVVVPACGVRVDHGRGL